MHRDEMSKAEIPETPRFWAALEHQLDEHVHVYRARPRPPATPEFEHVVADRLASTPAREGFAPIAGILAAALALVVATAGILTLIPDSTSEPAIASPGTAVRDIPPLEFVSSGDGSAAAPTSQAALPTSVTARLQPASELRTGFGSDAAVGSGLPTFDAQVIEAVTASASIGSPGSVAPERFIELNAPGPVASRAAQIAQTALSPSAPAPE